MWDFPGGSVVKNPPMSAGLIPGPGKFHMPYATKACVPQLLKPKHPSTYMLQLLKPTCLEPVRHSKRSYHSEKPWHCNEEWPSLMATRESPATTMKTQHNQK